VSSLLCDENLSRRLVAAVADLFPNSTHVRDCGLGAATDHAILAYAQEQRHVLVTRDADFEALSVTTGAKVIVLRIPDGPALVAANVLRRRAADVQRFVADTETTCLILG